MRCLVRGHHHDLALVRTIEQRGTGVRAYVWQCPTGRYRYFVPEGSRPSNAMRTTRPRYGWPQPKS